MQKLNINKNMIVVGIAVLAVVVTGVLVYANTSGNQMLSFLSIGKSTETVAKEAVEYLNKSVLQQGQTATLDGYESQNGVIKLNLTIGGSKYESYASKNGKLFFPEAFKLDGATNTTAQNTPAKQTVDTLAKVDKPMLEAYVVSQCPYGLQMQRAMASAISTIPSLAQYVKVRYIGAVSNGVITSMHGDAEAKENLRQICIRDEQSSKYWSYVGCYMKNGDGAGCQASTGVDSAKLSACISDSKRGLAYAQADFALDTKYAVQGSPTIVLNNAQVSEFDFGGRAADTVKTLICASATTKPDFCSQQLDTNQAATSFSLSYAGSGSTATTTASSNCAPATPN